MHGHTTSSTSGDHTAYENTKTFYDEVYDVKVGNDVLLYDAENTRRNLSSPTEEAPNLDADVVVHNANDGSELWHKQCDVVERLDNAPRAPVQRSMVVYDATDDEVHRQN